MLKLKKVAVTGGLASGKTTVCRLFEELGAYVVSADQIVHQLLSPETDLGKDLVRLLGADVVRGGKFDRGAIANKVFRDASLLEKLEKRVHPEVQKVIENHYHNVSTLQFSLFVVEVPLLFESGQDEFYDFILVVKADEERCKKRFIETGHYADDFEKRHKRLFSNEEKIRRADFVIENNESFEKLRQSIQTIFNSLMGSL